MITPDSIGTESDILAYDPGIPSPVGMPSPGLSPSVGVPSPGMTPPVGMPSSGVSPAAGMPSPGMSLPVGGMPSAGGMPSPGMSLPVGGMPSPGFSFLDEIATTIRQLAMPGPFVSDVRPNPIIPPKETDARAAIGSVADAIPGATPWDLANAPAFQFPLEGRWPIESTSLYAFEGARPLQAPEREGNWWTPESLDLGYEFGGPSLFDAASVRKDFPILNERVHGHRLVWLDNAATTQKPQVVIDRLSSFYEHENSNIHRAAHTLAARATDAYEGARESVRRFLNAPSTKDIVFVRGGTEAINLVAQSWGRRHVGPGDEIVITWLEHHANIVPWQQLTQEKGARLRVAPVDDRGQVILEEYERLLGPRTRLVSLAHVSNALGTIVPVREMTAMAHRYGARVLIDGAQAVSHMAVDVQLLDCDFYCFSGHKVFAPTGIGALFGKADVLESMPPWQGGGNMISDVTFERTRVQGPPARFEAGTGSIGDAVGLGAALDYLTGLGLENVSRHEHELLVLATECLLAIPGLTIIGTAPEKAGVLSFVMKGISPEDIGKALDQEGIAVRSGHHCAQPILRRFGQESTVRASLAVYNTRDDIDALAAALRRLATSP